MSTPIRRSNQKDLDMVNTLSYLNNKNYNMTLGQLKTVVPTFRTKKDALKAGREFGWRDVLRIEDRFEKVWIVGKMMIQPDDVGGCVFDEYRIPRLIWERNEQGVEFCPVIKFTSYRG